MASSARRHLHLHFLRNSGAAYWSGRWAALRPWADPTGHPRGALDRIRTRLHRLEKQNGESKESAQKSRWLEVRIAVLRARLDFPTDEVLKQLEQTVESRKKLNRKKEQKFLDQLKARLAQLESF